MNSVFTVAGVSKWNNEFKVRFANDLARVKMLVKRGNTDIDLIELPREMSKPEIVTFLKSTELYKNPQYAAAIDAADEKYNPLPREPKKRGRKPKAATVVSMDAIKARAMIASESETVSADA